MNNCSHSPGGHHLILTLFTLNKKKRKDMKCPEEEAGRQNKMKTLTATVGPA